LKRSNRFSIVSNSGLVNVAFTPKGGCPLKLWFYGKFRLPYDVVAFTPKGGCPLKPARRACQSLFAPM